MKEEIGHIGLEVPEDMPDMFLNSILLDLNTEGLKFQVRKRPELGATAALEWILPTAIITYIFKSYFDGFLTEAGKDHYIILKKWLKIVANNGRLVKITTVYATQSLDKQPSNNTQSKSFSILLQTKNNKIIKLLFDDDLEKEDWDNAIDQLLDFAIEHYEKIPNDNLTKELERFVQNKRSTVYAVIDKKSKKLRFYDERELIQLQRQK